MGTAGLTAMLCAFAVKAKEELFYKAVNDVLVTGLPEVLEWLQ